MRIGSLHAAQYNWQRIWGTRLRYRLNINGNVLEGTLFSIDEGEEEGVRSGYFKSKGMWYAVDKPPSEPLRVTLLRGSRVHFNCNGDEKHIRIVRQWNSENVPMPFTIELELA